MSITTAIISLLILGIIVGGLLVIKKTAKKFNLTEQQLERIKERNKVLDKKEQQEK
jgi:hypothetical protein